MCNMGFREQVTNTVDTCNYESYDDKVDEKNNSEGQIIGERESEGITKGKKRDV